jgi:hypothetical protein
MGFRKLLILLGVLLIALSGILGDWSIWLGGPIAFLGVIFQYVDRGS